MRWLQSLWLRLKRRRQLDRELEDELRFHLEMREQQNRDAGMSPEEAHRTALRQFGNVGLLKETSRELFGFGWIESLWQDIRYGIRTLGRSPALAATAVLSLALGIGANTAIFSVLDVVMLKSLPVEDPERL